MQMNDVMREELARAVNWRELGGMKTRGGAEVKRGTLYRSATLAGLSKDQLAALRGLQIRAIVDFRHNSERDEHPTPWQDMGCEDYSVHDHQPPGGSLNDILADARMTTAAARDLMIRAYQTLPYGSVKQLRQLFVTLATREGPFLFHCTAGKDRTGIAAALVLSVLDVPRDAILADYLATETYDILASPGYRTSDPLPAERLEELRPIYAVDVDYLAATFAALEARDGSIEGFLSGPLELTRADLDAVRRRLLV
jgi:protein-tyrosine phosphatase